MTHWTNSDDTKTLATFSWHIDWFHTKGFDFPSKFEICSWSKGTGENKTPHALHENFELGSNTIFWMFLFYFLFSNCCKLILAPVWVHKINNRFVKRFQTPFDIIVWLVDSRIFTYKCFTWILVVKHWRFTTTSNLLWVAITLFFLSLFVA